MNDRSSQTTPEAAEVRYGPGSAEWIKAAKEEIERLRAENETLRLDAEMDGSTIRALRAALSGTKP